MPGYYLADLSELSDLHLQALAGNALHLSIREQLRDTRLRTLQELIWQCAARRPRVYAR